MSEPCCLCDNCAMLLHRPQVDPVDACHGLMRAAHVQAESWAIRGRVHNFIIGMTNQEPGSPTVSDDQSRRRGHEV